jgi:hypothetical protein
MDVDAVRLLSASLRRPQSGFYGVDFVKKNRHGRKKWRARIKYGGKEHDLGLFSTKEEAAVAYDREARQHGNKDKLNYISIAAAEEAVPAEARAASIQPKARPASGFYGVCANKKLPL